MNHLFEHYLSRLRSKNDLERTVRNNATILGLYETWALAQGHEPMAIAPMDAQAYLDFCRAEGKAPSTIARYRTILKATWQFAADMELLPGRNPWRLTVAPRQQLAEPAIWETCDLRAMLDAALDPIDRMLLRCLFYTGMRVSEAVGMQWDDVNWDLNLIDCIGKGGKPRAIPVHPALRAALLRCRSGHGQVIGIQRSRAYYRIIAMVERAGVERDPGQATHSFRKTVASNLHRNGVPADDIDKIMGWAPTSIRARHYQRIAEPQLQAAMCKLYADDPIEVF